MRTERRWAVLSALALSAAGGAEAQRGARPACDPENGGIALPQGFCAVVVADSAAPENSRLRHLAVEPDGDVYVAVPDTLVYGLPEEYSHSARSLTPAALP